MQGEALEKFTRHKIYRLALLTAVWEQGRVLLSQVKIMIEREVVFTVDWVSAGPVAATCDSRGKVKVSCVADPQQLAPEAEPAASQLQEQAWAQTQGCGPCRLSHHCEQRSWQAQPPKQLHKDTRVDYLLLNNPRYPVGAEHSRVLPSRHEGLATKLPSVTLWARTYRRTTASKTRMSC